MDERYFCSCYIFIKAEQKKKKTISTTAWFFCFTADEHTV